jgi:SAM-dependent MidA family methyltransferase
MLLPAMNPIANVIYRHIIEAGPMTFARFMELALYCPELGFYERFPHRIGRSGDYYTSVSVGPLFGQLLAFQFTRWLSEIESSVGRYRLIEAGAHDGQLSLDILTWLGDHAPSTLARLDYLILEPSERREEWQRTKLGGFAHSVRWIRDWAELSSGSVCGIIFCNELLDAFPVHRFGWNARTRAWFEYGVSLEEDRLVWCRLPREAATGSVQLPEVPEPVKPFLPDGFVVELVPGARRWWQQSAAALGHGRLVTIDYGLDAATILDPLRPEGSLRAYRLHQMARDLLADPGEQDLTAHVDFAALREVGEESGLRTEKLVTQGRFLTGVMEQVVRSHAPGFDWSRIARSQFQTLSHPEQLGERFKVLIQARGDVGSSQTAAGDASAADVFFPPSPRKQAP